MNSIIKKKIKLLSCQEILLLLKYSLKIKKVYKDKKCINKKLELINNFLFDFFKNKNKIKSEKKIYYYLLL